MSFDQGIILLTILAAVVLFSFEWLEVDVVAIMILLVLVLSGVVPPDVAFRGFSSDATILILGLLILTAGLNRTGVVEILGRSLFRRVGKKPENLVLIVMLVTTVLSAFISNTASTAFLIPVAIGLARKVRMSTSRVLMPLAFASILSSSVTLVSTSTNVVVSGIMVQKGLAPISMFELAPVGIPITIAGILYMNFIGVRLLPKRIQKEERFEEIGAMPFFAEMIIPPGSPLVNKTLEETNLGRDMDLTVVRVIRQTAENLVPSADLLLEQGDLLIVETGKKEILQLKEMPGINLTADLLFSDVETVDSDLRLAEAIVLLRSPLVGRTLKSVGFRERYGVQVLAINRHGETIQQKISQIEIKLGDVLLIQGERHKITALEADQAFRLVGEVSEPFRNTKKAPLALTIFTLTLVLATLGIISLPIAALIGVLAMFLTRCITPEEAYRDVEWKAIILISSMLGLGIAMEYTGTSDFLAEGIAQLFGNSDPRFMLAAFFMLSMLLTQPMSNQAAAAVIVPVALQTAIHLGLNPRTFAMMIAVGASCSYLTPLEPSCLMVYGPGRYRFSDFLKVGSLLTVIIFILAIVLVPIFWPLT